MASKNSKLSVSSVAVALVALVVVVVGAVVAAAAGGEEYYGGVARAADGCEPGQGVVPRTRCRGAGRTCCGGAAAATRRGCGRGAATS